MRFIQVFVADRRLPAVRERLEEMGIDYAVTGGEDDLSDHALVQFPVPTDAVESVLDALYEAGLEEDAYTVVGSAESAMTPNMDALIDRYAEDYTPLAAFELQSKARSLARDTFSYRWMILLSAVVATVGLLVDSPAIVVGSMVIAPIVGPMLTVSVGASTGNWPMFRSGVKHQVVGLGLAVLGSAATAFALKSLYLVSPLLEPSNVELLSLRLSPTATAVLVGVAAGAAAAFGVTTKGPLALIGVTIAAALIPAAAATGIGIAWGAPLVAVGPLLLLLATILAINASLFATLWLLGYRSSVSLSTVREGRPVRTAKLAVVGVAILLLVAGTGAATAQQVSFQSETERAVSDVLERPRYDSLAVSGVTVEYDYPPAFSESRTVTVTVVRTSDRPYPSLASTLATAIRERTAESPLVRVQFREYEQAKAAPSASLETIPTSAGTTEAPGATARDVLR